MSTENQLDFQMTLKLDETFQNIIQTMKSAVLNYRNSDIIYTKYANFEFITYIFKFGNDDMAEN